jgi:hypothetical protein
VIRRLALVVRQIHGTRNRDVQLQETLCSEKARSKARAILLVGSTKLQYIEHTVFFLALSGDICYRVAEFIPYTDGSFILISLQ